MNRIACLGQSAYFQDVAVTRIVVLVLSANDLHNQRKILVAQHARTYSLPEHTDK